MPGDITLKTQEMKNIRLKMDNNICKPITYNYFCLMDKEYEVDLTKTMTDVRLGKYIRISELIF